MTELFTECNIGASEPFEVFHISDTHLTFSDERDDKRKAVLAKHRFKSFSDAKDNADYAVAASKKENIPIICTGDLIDFVSELNLDYAAGYNREADIFTCAGNHEFSLYVGEAWEDDEYKNRSLPRVQKSFSNDIIFSSRVINGVNFVALDNSYYLIKEKHLEMLREEVKKGFPVVLTVHVPLYTKELFDHQIKDLKLGDAGLMAAPDEEIAFYEDYRYRQQKADESTKAAFDYIVNEPGIKLILTGHLHYDYETLLPGGKRQIITGKDTLRKIRFS